MAVVVDASVALKWVIQEEGWAEARQLILDEVLIAPDLLFIECANVLWAKVRRGQILRPHAQAAMAAIESAPIRPVSSHLHASAAQAIAFDIDQTAYDSLYLAVALAERAVVVTADEALARAAEAHPAYRTLVRRLAP